MTAKLPMGRVLVRVWCGEPGAFHDRRGRTQFGPFQPYLRGEWIEVRRYGTRARRADEQRPPDPAMDPETGAFPESGPTKPQPGRNARPSDMDLGLRPWATRFVRQDGQRVSDRDEARVDYATRTGYRPTRDGREPAAPEDAAACRQFTFRCGCGLNRTIRADHAGELFDRLVAAGQHGIPLRELIRQHQRLTADR